MPMFQPLKMAGVIGFEYGGDGQVLDLDTVVKDGVLGDSNGGGGGGGGGGNIVADDKFDLKKLIDELDLPDIPSVFVCPISLDPMQDPVTLCTGQTYERPNILKWFSLGHFTCPTTMQELWDDAVTPNTTLYHLIHTWFSQKYLEIKKRSEDVQGRAIELVATLKRAKGQARVQALHELRQVSVAQATARKTLVDVGGISVISSFLGPLTSHAVGSEAIAILGNLDLDSESKTNLMQPAKISLMVDMLNEGSIDTKINCARLIKSLVEEKAFRSELVSSHSLLFGLMRLVKDKRHRNGILPGISLLKSISLHKQVRHLMVRIGAIPQLIDLLPSLDPECLESALFVLDVLCSTQDGRLALKDCSNTLPIMVRVLMRVSENCTNYALSILWSVCKLAPEETSPMAVEFGLAAKLLLVIQSGCDQALKQRSVELLKLCSLNYTDTMFISKCKLTRTMQ